MDQRATDTPEQAVKFAPKEKAPNRVAQLDDAGKAIVAQIRTAADMAKEDCDRAMSLAHKLSERPKTEHSKWRGRLSTGETEQPARNKLRTIQNEIEEKLLARRSSSGAEGVAVP
jgi:hypothetical protein